ncbi:MAG: RagB/SusD family nutrient uptake outer membrane protein [Anditalea sp.]
MKSLTRIFFYSLIPFIVSCEEDYLDRSPMDAISSADYWKTSGDLELYVNQFYPTAFAVNGGDRYEGIFAADLSTDDMVPVQVNDRLRGSRVVPSTGGWNYSSIRSVNYFLENYTNVEDDFESYKHYVGEAYFFRAFFYFSLVKQYGDVPLVGKVLNMDSEELYGPKSPRNQVIDLVVADLDLAIEYMTSGINENRTRLSKEIALLFKSRVCLYEGTWEKYHQGTVFGVENPDPEKYFQLAEQAAEAVMNTGIYEIYSTGNSEWDYFMFGEIDYSNNQEVLLWKKYDLSLNQGHARQFQIANGKSGGTGLTKSLVDSYLCRDGNPIYLSGGSTNPLYEGDGTLNKVVSNRDPRLRQTVFTPGFPLQIIGADTVKFTRPVIDEPAHTKNTTGYQISKTLNFDPIHHITTETLPVGYTGWIIFRYAEVLLNYAEAKAELGTLTQSDVDKSIKLLRDRVSMPNLILSDIQPDPNWQFPTLSPTINEIRRERRVELVLEGFRWDDIARWAAADELIVGKRFLGAKFNSTDYSDLSPSDFRLTNGYFDDYKEVLPAGFGFEVGRDYLSPISTQELTLNPELVQNPGW